jgi:hypothetical protein
VIENEDRLLAMLQRAAPQVARESEIEKFAQ